MSNATLQGCPYPITPTTHGYFFSQAGVNQIKSDLLSLLLTNPKERVMTPDFGTDLRSLMFEPADNALATQAKNLIIAAIKKWEPRIAVDAITTSVDPTNNVLNINIAFIDPGNIQVVELLSLEIPLVGGSNS